LNEKLRFWVIPDNDVRYEVDLSEFAVGATAKDTDPRGRSSWKGNYQGRPLFAEEVAAYFRILRPTKGAKGALASHLRTLFRFLDTIDPECNISSCALLNTGHGIHLKDWLKGQGSTYKKVKIAVDGLRSVSGASVLFWPTPDREALPKTDEIEEEGVRRLYSACKKEAMSIKAMLREGAALAAQGRDPRGRVSAPNSAAWDSAANHAWLIRELTQERLLFKEEFEALNAFGLNQRADIIGPKYLAPGMGPREGIVGKLRWFYLGLHDVAVFLWLFLICTGWNLSTTLALDVTRDDLWCEDHPHQPEKFAVLHAFKARSDKHVFGLSMKRPEWHPYQVLRWMIKHTEPLRRTAQTRLDDAKRAYAHEPTQENAREVERLEAIVRSPWLYQSAGKIGEVNRLEQQDSSRLNSIIRTVVERHNLDERFPLLRKMSTGAARDAWIGHAYVQSGYNLFIARLAAQHADLRSSRHYLRRLRMRTHSEKMVHQVQNALFSEIRAGRPLDPTRLRLLVMNDEISPAQEARLLDRRKRTRLGMGCLDPTRPPPEIAPDHVVGALCRVQRCTGCRHGVVFDDSLEALVLAMAELLFIKRQIPLASWLGTSFEDEERSLDATLQQFGQPKHIEALIQTSLSNLLSRQVTPHEAYPLY
jgi:hypothetical protein